MKIAYLTADRGAAVFTSKGASIHVQELVNAMAALGHRVRLLTSRRGSMVGPLQAEVIKVRPAPSRWSLPAWIGAGRLGVRAREEIALRTSAAMVQRLRKLHAEERFDLIYERGSLWSTAGVRAAQELQIPCVVEVNAPLLEEQRRYRKLVLASTAEAIEGEVLGRADVVLAVSEPVRRYVVAKGASPSRAFVMPNGVDPTRFHPGVPPEPLDGVHGKFIVGFAGTFKAWHGIDVLLEAFKILAERSPDYHLLLVGKGPLKDRTETWIKRAGLTARVTMTGWVPHERLPQLIQRMQVPVLPAPVIKNFYFSPLKLFEYMAVGKPVVASAIGQIPDILTDGITGLLTRPGDAQDLAHKIERLRQDPQLSQALGRAAAKAARRHTWERNVSRVTALVASLQHNGRSRRALGPSTHGQAVDRRLIQSETVRSGVVGVGEAGGAG